MEQENIRKETFLATLLLLAGTLILWKGYSYEPDSRQFPVFLGWLFVSFSILNAITLFKKFKAEKLSLSFELHRPGFPLSLTILLLRKLCKIRNFSQSPFGGFIFEESDGNFPSGRN